MAIWRIMIMQIDLKAYTSRAKELEVAIHTQRNLMSSYEQAIKNQVPVAPTKKEISAPVKPQEPKEPISANKTPFALLILLIGLAIMFICLWFGCITSDDRHIGVQFMELIWLALGVVCALGTYGGFKERKDNAETYEKQKAQYERDKNISRNITFL